MDKIRVRENGGCELWVESGEDAFMRIMFPGQTTPEVESDTAYPIEAAVEIWNLASQDDYSADSLVRVLESFNVTENVFTIRTNNPDLKQDLRILQIQARVNGCDMYNECRNAGLMRDASEFL